MSLNITVSSMDSSQLFPLELSPEMTVGDLKSIISAMTTPAVPAATLNLYHNGSALADPNRSLGSYNLKNDDMIIMLSQPAVTANRSRPANNYQFQSTGQHQASNPAYDDAEIIRQQVLSDPERMANVRQRNPELAAAVNDPEQFRNELAKFKRRQQEVEEAKRREHALLNEYPFDVEAQQKIEELIRQEQVMENLQNALEHHPEVTFGRVTMLYIPVEVNGVKVKAFVDSGAQATIMSPDCAQRCNIMRLVDSRFSGIARGVGTAKILGRVHSAPIKIGKLHLACSFTVMEGKDVDLLLGLDMLKRHQAVLDLCKGKLVIQDEEVEFLGESEIPKGFDAEDEETADVTVEGPAGSKMSAKTGAVVEPPHPEKGPAAPAVQVPPAVGASSSSSGKKYNEDMIARLMEGLGISREQAVSALDMAGGDVELAASLLFSQEL